MMNKYNLIDSFKFALQGIWFALKTQRNMRLHFLAAVVVLVLSWMLSLPVREFLLVLTAVFLVIITETINTAVEATVDMFTEEYNELARVPRMLQLVRCFWPACMP